MIVPSSQTQSPHDRAHSPKNLSLEAVPFKPEKYDMETPRMILPK